MSDLPPPVGIRTNASYFPSTYSMISRCPARNDSCPKYCLSACSILSKVKRFLTHMYCPRCIPYLYRCCTQSRNIRAINPTLNYLSSTDGIMLSEEQLFRCQTVPGYHSIRRYYHVNFKPLNAA